MALGAPARSCRNATHSCRENSATRDRRAPVSIDKKAAPEGASSSAADTAADAGSGTLDGAADLTAADAPVVDEGRPAPGSPSDGKTYDADGNFPAEQVFMVGDK